MKTLYSTFLGGITLRFRPGRAFGLPLLLLLASCGQTPDYLKLAGTTMGTSYHVTLAAAKTQQTEIQAQIDQRLEQINQLMSTYLQDSELSRFNRARTTACYPLSVDTIRVIRSANEISRLSNGKFDVTLAPLIEIWGFDNKDTADAIPSDATITRLLARIGYQKLIMEQGCVRKAEPDLSVNLSAIAKGYAVDEIARLLKARNIEHYLVEIGGEVATRGLNSRAQTWQIAIESPTDARGIQRIIQPQGMGVATSGDYRNYFEKDGVRYSHTIDPTNGKPISHKLASVTVVHRETMVADALATAFMVMGPQAALRLATQNQIPVFLLLKNEQGFAEAHSPAFSRYLAK